jgi:hypothetical protein
MKFDSNVFWKVFALLMLLEVCLFSTGCTAAWITAVNALLPSLGAVVAAVLSFIAALQGKTVSAATYAAIQKWQGNLTTSITDVEAIVASIKKSATTALLAQFQAAMQAVLQQFNSLLGTVDITDSATIAKLTQFLALGVAAINAILALIPMAIAKLKAKASAEELKLYDNLSASAIKSAESTMRETYVAIVMEHTANADVNAALDALPRSI